MMLGLSLGLGSQSTTTTAQQLAALLSGSSDSGMFDLSRAFDNAGTLTVQNMAGNLGNLLQATTANKPAIVAAGLQFDSGAVDFISAIGTIETATVIVRLKLDGGTVGRILGNGAASFRATYQSGSATSNGTSIYVDGVQKVTRGDLYTAIAGGAYHTVEDRAVFYSLAAIALGSPSTSMQTTVRRMVVIDHGDVADVATAQALARLWVAQGE